MAYPTNLPNNNSGIDVVRVDGRLYLVMNPVSGNWAARTPLVVLRSDDNGRNFEVFKILSDVAFDEYHGRMAEFSYPAIVAHAHRLYVSYTYMRKAIAFKAASKNAPNAQLAALCPQARYLRPVESKHETV